MPGKTYLDLEGEIRPEPRFDDWDVARYWEWEQKIAQPALEAAGWTVLRWYSIEKDSFGPLQRGAVCEKSGRQVIFYYG